MVKGRPAIDGFSHARDIEPLVFISTGCSLLDAYLGSGRHFAGYPLGRFIEISGVEGAAKTTLAMHAMASVTRGRGARVRLVEDKETHTFSRELETYQIEPGMVYLADTEHKFDMFRASSLGVDLDRVERLNPAPIALDKKKMTDTNYLTLNMVLQAARRVFESVKDRKVRYPVLFVWDSLGGTPDEEELKSDALYAGGLASKARQIRAIMRRLSGELRHHEVTMLICNQVYDRIGVPGTETSGGRGLRFHASLRLELKPVGGFGLPTGDPLGVRIRVRCKKSSFCSPAFSFELPVRYASGLDDETTLVEFFSERPKMEGNPVTKSGSYYYIEYGAEKPLSANGLLQVQGKLKSTPEAMDILRECLLASMQNGVT